MYMDSIISAQLRELGKMKENTPEMSKMGAKNFRRAMLVTVSQCEDLLQKWDKIWSRRAVILMIMIYTVNTCL